ncbi:MFS transporter [Nocardioides sediminis]|uniref:MFS transporter n=1 Tax=Nocardioides sediminis TaxID=433648 RepID=UPI0019005087|nr:MFS transporter [Nocardioides sediminis]
MLEPSAPSAGTNRSRVFPLLVFLVTFGLLLSDYMSRQVLSAVFPFLKVEWALSDTQLGALTSVVALTVGLLAVPLSLLGDRWGRSKAILAMATLWSLATLGSAVATSYEQMMVARLLIGLGEAAYGSVGLAVVLMVFSPTRRASLTGAFMAGGSFGSVLGVFLGGILAVQLGWRWSFGVMALIGLVLVAVYALFIDDAKLARHQHPGNAVTGTDAGPAGRAPLRTLVSTPSVICAYVASGLQLFVAGTLFAWLPSYLNRAYQLAPDRAGVAAAGFILLMGVGMIVCGVVTDRISHHAPQRKWTSSLVYVSLSLVLLGAGFSLTPGAVQLTLIAAGTFFAAGTAGPAGAMVANLTPASIRATAFGTLTMANNLLGLAAGPVVTGILADRLGLSGALQVVPFVSVPVVVALVLGLRAYPASVRRARTSFPG